MSRSCFLLEQLPALGTRSLSSAVTVCWIMGTDFFFHLTMQQVEFWFTIMLVAW